MPLVPILAIASMAVLAVFLFMHYPSSVVITAAWLALGAGVYYGYSRTHEAEHLERESWMERIEREEYSVLVAVSNPGTVDSLVEVGAALARKHGGVLVVVSVEEVPEGLSLMTGRQGARELQPMLDRAARYAEKQGVAARTIVKIARRASHGILETAREERCNLLVLGAPERGSFVERLLPSAAERIIRAAPCQVAIVYGPIRPGEITGIAVPVAKGSNAELAAELASVFAGTYGGAVRALTILEPGMDGAEVDRAVAEAKQTLEAGGLGDRLQVLWRRDVALGLARAFRRGELVLIGAARSGSVAELLSDSIPATIGKLGRNPMVVVRDVVARGDRGLERAFFSRS